MAGFTNIAKDDASPLLLDAANISVVMEMAGGGKEQPELFFSSFQSEGFLHIHPEGWNVDTDLAVARLSQAAGEGGAFFEFPFVWGDREKIGRIFVNPKAFNYVVCSAPFVPGGGTEPHVAMQMGVDGQGEVTSYEVPLKQLELFMDAVKRDRPGIRRVDPGTASAGFRGPGFVLFDPAKLTQVCANGNDIDLKFECAGIIDFSLPNPGWGNRLLNRKVTHPSPKIRNMWQTKLGSKENGGTEDLNALCAELQEFDGKARRRMQREFARKAAAGVPQLTRVEGGKTPFYMRFNKVAWISSYTDESKNRETSLCFRFAKESPEGRGTFSDRRVYFKTPEAARKELDRLTGIVNAPKPAP